MSTTSVVPGFVVVAVLIAFISAWLRAAFAFASVVTTPTFACGGVAVGGTAVIFTHFVGW